MRRQYGIAFQAPICPVCKAEQALTISGPWNGPGWPTATIVAEWVCDAEQCGGSYADCTAHAQIQDLPVQILAEIGAKCAAWLAS
jgi:hypothetical protein